jgi:propanediol dehydratase large subunit
LTALRVADQSAGRQRERFMAANRWQRFSDWDERPLRLDKFAVEDAEDGFAAFNSPHDPKPS